MSLVAGANPLWEADFESIPDGGLQGFYRASLTIEFPGWGTCLVNASVDAAIIPTSPPTFTPGPTDTPSPTPTPLFTPTSTYPPAPPD